ncbi:uncharacterized protein LOC124418814 [Lucilia cuprina]|uniref:uncharacterized protein LOC124418814 n=1 Tax=Lucilia cuprina TaxID=7375 RepID=UPI001F06A92E|nr:uncharacterized protein LOC124418814 [Lucilia cuprina]
MKSLVFKSLMLIMVLQDVTTVLAKPTTKAPIMTVDKTQPLYELQLAVWPTDVDDIIEAVMPPNNEIPQHTLIEQPVVVMPDMDYTQNDDDDNGIITDNFADDDEDLDVVYDPTSDLWPIITGEPEASKPTDEVIVLENYHHKYDNGSEEYKLVLSNGMVNYQRIDHVLVKGVWRPVQQGYYTVPSMAGTRESYQTTYYRADTNGYNVYKTERSPRNPAYDIYLQYAKEQDAKLQGN